MTDQAITDIDEVRPERRPLTKPLLFAYSLPATPLALAGLPMGVYLPVIYADHFGLSLIVVGWLLWATRISDAVTDPWIGYWSDRIRTRWGRRKPFVLLGTPIYGVAIALLFIVPFEFSDVTWLGQTFSNGYAWMFVMLVFTYLGATIKDLPFSAWGAELSSNYHERSLIRSWREFFGVGGALIAAFTPVALVAIVGLETKPIDAVTVLIIGLCIFMPLTTAITLVTVPEYPVYETKKERIKLRESLRYVLTNRAYVFLLIIFATSAMGSAMTNTLSVFFVKHVLGVEELYGYYLAPYFICQMAGIPLWMKLSRKIGKHKATMWAIGWYALWSSFIPLITLADNDLFTTFRVQSLLAFLPSDTYQTYMTYFEGIDTGKHLWFLVVMCLKGSAIGALSALPAAMCADVIDVDTAQTGKRQGGAYFSIWSMVQKWSYAFGITIGLSLVVWWGFDEHADPKSGTNTAFTLLMLACVYSVIPALFKFVGMPLLWMYPLTEEKVSEVQDKIAENERSSPNVSA